MPEATEQTITTWASISSVDAMALFTKIYQSKVIAEEKILRGLAAGQVRWDCLELIIRKKRDLDPGRGDPKFWHRLPRSAIHLPEGWARRREMLVNRRPPIELCDYRAVGLIFAYEDLIGLLPPAEQARLAAEAEAEAEAKAEAAVREAENETVAAPEAEEVKEEAEMPEPANEPEFQVESITKPEKRRKHYWDDDVDRVLAEEYPNGSAKNFEPGDVVDMVHKVLADKITVSGREKPSRGLILRKTGHWES